jgi:hypothetical protein
MARHSKLVSSQIKGILKIEEAELFERTDKDRTSNSLSSSSETLFQIETARLMDPDVIPDLLWK